MTRRFFLRLAALCSRCSGFSPACALKTLDRAKQPPIGKIPELRVPTWTKAKLSNGAELIVSEKHDLPLVSFSITFLGGTDQFETADRRGVGSLAAAMMSEGTKTRNGDDLSNALQLLGTNVSVGVGGENGSISFVSTTARFAATLDILADMLVNSTFPPEALERLRAQRLVALNQAKAQPGSIAVACVSARPLRRRASARPVVHRADGQGHHARRRRRFSSAILQAGPRAHHRRRRCHARGDSPGHRKRSGELGGRRRAARRSHFRRFPRRSRRRFISSTSRARRSRRLRSACLALRAPRPTTTRCR